MTDSFAPVPNYLRSYLDFSKGAEYKFSDISPGHIFHFYGKWLESPKDISVVKTSKSKVLESMSCGVDSKPAKLAQAINNRNERLLENRPEQYKLSLSATTTSPLIVGSGNPHLIEAGLSFLSPYGLPYLAGSSIKGVLRHGAELAKETNSDLIDDIKINSLFGNEDKDNPSKGVLYFWDVIPYGGSTSLLKGDVLTSHLKEYLQEGKSPAETYEPVPIHFLVIPRKSKLSFNITWDSLPEGFTNFRQVQEFIYLVMNFASCWIGFGAKTSSGYGRIQISQPIFTKSTALKESLSSSQSLDTSEELVKEMVQAATASGGFSPTLAIKFIKENAPKEKSLDLAIWLREKLKKDTLWKETSNAKRPEKDTKHKNTLEIMELIKNLEEDEK